MNVKKNLNSKIERDSLYLAQIIDNAYDAILSLDIDFNIVIWNKAAENIYGWKADEVIDKNLNDIIPVEFPYDNRENVIKKFFENGYWTGEVIQHHKNGAPINIFSSSKIIKDVNGNLTGIVVINREITDRKRAEQRLKESEEKYRRIFEVIPDLFFLIRKDGTYLDYKGNPELLYVPPEDFIGKNLLNILPKKEADLFSDAIQKTLVNKNPKHLEYSLLIRGKINYFEARMLYFSDDQVALFIRDISDRILAEQKLKESEKKYKSLANDLEMILDHIPALVFYKDNENKFIRLNKYHADAHNLRKEDMQGVSCFDIYPREQAQAYWDDDLEVIKSGMPKLNIIESWDTPNGKRWALTSKIPYFDETGNVIGIIGLASDITERKEAEEKLKESEKNYRDLYEEAPNAYFSIAADKTIIRCNKAAEELIGYSKTELSKMIVFDLYAKNEFGLETAKEVFQSFLLGDDINDEELQMQTKDGKKIWILLSVKPLYDKKGDIIESRSIVVNIDERKKAEERLKKSEANYREAFERAEFYKDLFAHDISNILQNIQSSLDLISMWQNIPQKMNKIDELITIINDQLIRGSKLVSNIRKLSEISETESPLEAVDGLRILKEAKTFIHKSFPNKEIMIKIEPQIDEVRVNANQLLLDIFENILFNGIKYNENKKIEFLVKISREIRNDTKFTKFEFIDNGIGIPDIMKEQIFRGISNRKIKVHGMRLGLLLVKKVLSKYNGDIWVEDSVKGDPSQGSNFIILIPEVV